MLKKLFKCVAYGTILFILLLGIAFMIINLKDISLKDMLFIEGIIIVIGTLLSTIEDSQSGFYLRSFEERIISDLFDINKDNKIRTSISANTTSLSILIGGIITLIVSAII